MLYVALTLSLKPLKGGIAMVKIELCTSEKEMNQGIEALVNVFENKHTYYKTWCMNKKKDLASGKRALLKILNEKNIPVGYAMINFVNSKYAKLNAVQINNQFQQKGYCKETFYKIFDMLRAKGYEIMFIQTRFYNKTVLHMFETMGFDVLGQKFHEIEQMNNVVACYPLEGSYSRSEECAIAQEIYEGFTAK